MTNLENESILTRLIRMEEKLDSYLFRTTVTESKLDAHDTRLRLLEQGNAKIAGIAACVALVVSTFGVALFDLIGKAP